jgi:hypothetical protein
MYATTKAKRTVEAIGAVGARDTKGAEDVVLVLRVAGVEETGRVAETGEAEVPVGAWERGESHCS